MTDINLNALKAGINRIRTKGGADPSSLYDLINGYVTIDGSIQSRPGTTRHAVLPAGTRGLCAFNGAMVVFSGSAKTGLPAGYSCEVLVHPTDDTQEIAEIHFAAPFLGFLYVVAEFSDGQVFHYWLQSNDPWQASTVYLTSDTVRPASVNGFIYRPTTSNNPAAWAPNTTYAVGDQVQPTIYNGYAYEVVEIDGDTPDSGNTEPTWIASEGALVYEDVDNTPASTATSGGNSSPGGSRYDNLPSYKQVQLDNLR